MRQPLTANQVIGFWYDGKCAARLNSRVIKADGAVFDARTTRAICTMRVESHKTDIMEFGPVIERALKALWGGTECFDKMSLAADFVDSLAVSLIAAPLYPAYMDEAFDHSVTSPTEYTLTEIAAELKMAHRTQAKRLLEAYADTIPGCNKCGGRWYVMPEALEELKKLKKVVDIAA